MLGKALRPKISTAFEPVTAFAIIRINFQVLPGRERGETAQERQARMNLTDVISTIGSTLSAKM